MEEQPTSQLLSSGAMTHWSAYGNGVRVAVPVHVDVRTGVALRVCSTEDVGVDVGVEVEAVVLVGVGVRVLVAVVVWVDVEKHADERT